MAYEILGNKQTIADTLREQYLGDWFPASTIAVKVEPKFDDPKFDVVGLAPIMTRYKNDTPIFQRLNDLQIELVSSERPAELPAIQEKVNRLNDLLKATENKNVSTIAINRLVPAGEVVSCKNVLEKMSSAIEIFNYQVDDGTDESVEKVKIKHQSQYRLDVKYRESSRGDWLQGTSTNFRTTPLSTAAKNGDYTEALRILSGKPYYIFIQNTERKTPLVIAAEASNPEFIAKVLEASMVYVEPSDINGKPILDAINNSSMTRGQKRELSILIKRLRISTT